MAYTEKSTDQLTTQDVIDALRANGWRYERLPGYPRHYPMPLTNGKPGTIFCVSCGNWFPHKKYAFNEGRCKGCASERRQARGKRLQQSKEMNDTI